MGYEFDIDVEFTGKQHIDYAQFSEEYEKVAKKIMNNKKIKKYCDDKGVALAIDDWGDIADEINETEVGHIEGGFYLPNNKYELLTPYCIAMACKKFFTTSGMAEISCIDENGKGWGYIVKVNKIYSKITDWVQVKSDVYFIGY